MSAHNVCLWKQIIIFSGEKRSYTELPLMAVNYSTPHFLPIYKQKCFRDFYFGGLPEQIHCIVSDLE